MSTPARDHTGFLPVPPMVGTDDGWALFLDVDGTLLDFARRPDDVRVEAPLNDDLARTRSRLSGAVALLSGRPLSELDNLFDWHTQPAAGLHGAELRMPDGGEQISGDTAAFEHLREQATGLIANTHGVMLEDKRRALALHYRQAPAAGDCAERVARTLLRRAGDSWTLQHGDHVIELKPAGINKGHALDALMEQSPFRGRRPWMLGDDFTDEDAFERANQHGGVSVIVGARRPTVARCALATPAAVRGWLHALAGE